MKTKDNYMPHPIDTSDVELPESLKPLLEMMAKNVHELWAEERLRQGWSYGEKRNDELKQHPCLVAYEELPEEEKVYDRRSSEETLKVILKSGFKIVKA
ncbi:MAG: Ryanodine receptor Ryr [Prevotella sp.]|nr:Ryanodine receptor Ryr [Prevotella sp.]